MTSLRTGTAVAAAALCAPNLAYACGGFFCNNMPVDQAAERIVFAYDEAAGQVETHVQITYQGEAEDFAWVVPVPAAPEIFLTTDALFDSLGAFTPALWYPSYDTEGVCDDGSYWFAPEDEVSYSSSANGGYYGVTVLASDVVGPYETVTLEATSADGLIAWLEANDYDLPDNLDPLLVPYVAAGGVFVALRLQNGFDAGDISPLGFRYPGTRPAVPIQLTAVAATPDMRLEVFVIGPNRAVPESYLHLIVNDAIIDWTTNGSNYNDVITRAADEAGGHGFATDYAGPSADWLWAFPSSFNLDGLEDQDDPVAWMDRVISSGIPASDTLLGVLRNHIPMPADLVADGVDENSFYNCLACYDESLVGQPFDPVAATADLIEFVAEPSIHAHNLLAEHPWLTRMTSSLSPAEMTVDPTFVFNPDLPGVEQIRTAEITTMCDTGTNWYDSIRRIELTDGREIYLPSMAWFDDRGITVAEWLMDTDLLGAALIEQLGSSGAGEVIFDVNATGDDALDALNDEVLGEAGNDAIEAEGCGCDHGRPATGLVAGAALIALLRRRRS